MSREKRAWIKPIYKALDEQTAVLRYSGAWAIDPNSSPISKRLYSVYNKAIVAIVCTFTATVFADLCFGCDDLSIVTDDGCIFAGISVVLFKLVIFQIRRDKIAELIDATNFCVGELCVSSNEIHAKIVQRYTYREKLTFYCFFTLGIVLVIALVGFVPTEGGGLPIRARYPFDTTTSPGHEVAFLHQASAVFWGMISIVAMDNIVLTLCSRVILQFEILNLKFLTCPTAIGDGDAFAANFKNCVRHHQRLIDLVDRLNELFGSSMFVQLLASTSMICLTGFQVVLVVGQGSSDFVKFAIYLGAALSQLLYWCWIGNEVTHESSSVAESQWHSGWEREPFSEVAFLVIFSQMRAKKPLQIKAGEYYPMSMGTFIAVLRGSYSYFSLLNKVHSEFEDQCEAL